MNKGFILIFIAVLQWAFLGIFIKNIEKIPPSGIVIGRLFLGSLFLIVIILIIKKYRLQFIQSFYNVKFYLLISLIMSAHFLLATLGYVNTTVANASLLTNTMPIFVPLLATIFLTEKVNKKEIYGVIIAFIGILTIFISKGVSFDSKYFLGNFFSLLSAILLAIYTIIGRKNITNYSPLITMFWMCFISANIILLFNVFTKESFLIELNYKDLKNLLGVVFVGTFGHLAYFSSLKYLKSVTASSIALSTPIFAMIYANIFLSQTYTIINLMGIFISLFGILITVYNSHSKNKQGI